MSFAPLHDRVLAHRIGAGAKTAGGRVIPDTANETPQQGEIVAVGAGAGVKDAAGETVLFGKQAGPATERDGEELMIMKESDSLGVMA